MAQISSFLRDAGALFTNLFLQPDWRNVFDVAIMTVLIYYIIKLLIHTRASAVFKGIAVVLVFAWVSDALQLNALNWLLQQVISMGLLVLVIIPGNPLAITRNNATRWLGIPGTSLQFQPSEIAKVAIITYFADSISRKKDKMRSFRYGVLPYAFILVVVAGLVAVEPHLSGAILILGAGAAMMLVGGINWIWVGTAAGAAVGMVYVALFVIGYNKSRVIYWLDPWADAADKGYQLSQSLITIGSGGLWGLGLGKSRQKFLFLPEEHNDFIFSIVCEELGLVGAGIIMLLFAALILRGYWIALHTRDRFGTLLVVGFTTQLAVQVFLNIGVVTGLLPTTGISLPFFSYGGTALLIQLAEMGVILSVSRQMKPTKAG